MNDHLDDIVSAWHRELPDLDTSALATIGRLLRATHFADERLGGALAEYGLQPGWFDLLAALRRAGEPFELNPTELMRATMLSSGGMTKRLDRMADAGLVERRPDPDDRRGTRVRLTAKGRETIEGAIRTHTASEEHLLSVLTTHERRMLDRILRKLLAELEDGGHETRGPRSS